MVRPGVRRWQDERGRSRLGCLLTLLIVVFAGYYGVQAGEVYLRYWRLLDEMKSQARLAPSVDDATIQRRLYRKMDELNLPDEAYRGLTIRRVARPREIHISTEWQEILELPFYPRTITLRPSARQPL